MFLKKNCFWKWDLKRLNSDKKRKKMLSAPLVTQGEKSIGAIISIGREIQCLPCAGFSFNSGDNKKTCIILFKQ